MTTIGDVINSIKALYEFVMAIFKTIMKLAGKDEEEDAANEAE